MDVKKKTNHTPHTQTKNKSVRYMITHYSRAANNRYRLMIHRSEYRQFSVFQGKQFYRDRPLIGAYKCKVSNELEENLQTRPGKDSFDFGIHFFFSPVICVAQSASVAGPPLARLAHHHSLCDWSATPNGWHCLPHRNRLKVDFAFFFFFFLVYFRDRSVNNEPQGNLFNFSH